MMRNGKLCATRIDEEECKSKSELPPSTPSSKINNNPNKTFRIELIFTKAEKIIWMLDLHFYTDCHAAGKQQNICILQT